MVTNKEKEIIIDAIRVLRSRRVRPSARKIAWYARREHLLSEATTEAVLDELVETEDVLRVEYKGATSYRVAASWSKAALVRRRPTRTKVNVMNSESTCRALRQAVAGCGVGGASKEDIKEKLIACGHGRLVDKLDVLLHREIRAGTLLRVETTHRTASLITYVVPADAPPTSISPPSPPVEEVEVEDSDVGEEILDDVDEEETMQGSVIPHEFLEIKTEPLIESEHLTPQHDIQQIAQQAPRQMPMPDNIIPPPPLSPTEGLRRGMGGIKRGRRGRPPLKGYDMSVSSRGRTPSRRNKRAKKVFDPSEGGLAVVGRKKAVYRCDVCYQTVNQHSVHEDLLVCHRCSARAHPSCMGYSAELAVRSRLGPWTCMDCKHCAICNMDHNIGTLIFCDECDRAYHLTCHQPPLNEQLQGSWICYACSPQSGQNGSSHNSFECLPGITLARDSPVPDDESRGSSGSWDNTLYDPEIPNVTHWSVEQIVEYFDEKGFKTFTDVFKEQDIDGTALLMLTRSDVLMGLNLKLGPALKMYRHVRILQTRLANPPLP